MTLREFLEEKRITYREFAEQLNIHLQSLKNIAYGKKKPSLELAIRIEELTEGRVTPKDLLNSFTEKNAPIKRKSVKKQI